MEQSILCLSPLTERPSFLIKDGYVQRYLAHIITERRIKTLALKSLPEELKAWSAPLPKEQWTKPSEAL
ncbi:MAG TPA: hypothetical protein VLA13_07935, partial [Massilibacterium sp.]|nr:hypothetical protein [Massilibacterium sp.]